MKPVIAPTLRQARSDVRCTHCGRLLLRWKPSGTADVEVKCPRCGSIDTIQLSTG